MSKIICEICGTTYQETAECCPICGCSRDAAADLLGEELQQGAAWEESAGTSAKKKQIFDFDEVNSDPEETDEQPEEEEVYEEEEEEEDRSRPNTFVVILLTLLIAVLLLTAGFIFVRYFLPNIGEDAEEPVVTTEAVIETTAEPTTELRIPCDGLVLTSGTQVQLKQTGFNHLINVTASPEDTTDTVVFASADESIATVSADGKITAVAEGETVVTISCGDFSFEVQVVCDFSVETEPTVQETESLEEQEPKEEPKPTKPKAPVDPNVVLKLKKAPDISMGVYYEVQLELDCGLEPTDVEWSSEHPHIASVDEYGTVKALKAGTTDIIIKYGDQELRCRVRCSY